MQSRKLKILKQVLGPYQKSGQEFLFSCPKCNHHKNKLSVNLEKDVYKCWVCDFKGHKIHRLVRKYGTILDRNDWEEISPIEIPSDLKEYIQNYFLKEVHRPVVHLPEQFESLSEFKKNRDHIRARNYLHSRGLTDWDIVYWKMGICQSGSYAGRIIIPSFDELGNVNYFVGRAYVDMFTKYKNPKVDRKNIIFNELYLDWTQDLTLVEGVFDAIKAVNAVPILGSTMGVEYKIFQEIIKHDTPVYVALDKDALRKTFDLIERLISYEIEVYKIDTTKIKTDIGDLTKEQFNQLKSGAILMTQNELLKEKMRAFM